MTLAAIEDALWALLGLLVVVPLLIGYRVWDLRASERLIRRWAEANGLTVVLLQRRRLGFDKPPMVSAGKHWTPYHFVARDAAGGTIDGWISVGSSSLSLKPNLLRIVVDGQWHEERF